MAFGEENSFFPQSFSSCLGLSAHIKGLVIYLFVLGKELNIATSQSVELNILGAENQFIILLYAEILMDLYFILV